MHITAACLTIPLCLRFSNAKSTSNGTFTLPQGTGPFRTTLQHTELIDVSRLDPFNSSHHRRLMISRFDPVPQWKCKPIQLPYVPLIVAQVEDEILAEYDYPKDVWERVRLDVCDLQTGDSCSTHGKFPIAMFSAGLNTTRHFSLSLAQEISSHGFTVILVDHPYDTDVVAFPGGDVIYGGRILKPVNGNTTSVDHALEVRADDISFVLDTIGITQEDKVVMFGHSFGGAATATTMLQDRRVKGGVNIDGTMFGPVLNSSLGNPGHPQKFLLWGSEGHNTTTDASWGQFWNSLELSKNVDWNKEFSIINSTHGSCWDLNVLVDVTGLRNGLTETARSLVGPIPGARIWEIMGRYLPAFFGYALNEKPEDQLLREPSANYLEVVILRE
ncbi:hypothetical protein BDV96DRAFT_596202 [Lophiotrema nucula]|uniref:1-alkyl-2-acetylglycerophosphocholine esterase n=1 Tax=Lophiotrema nucula TaxID=690887 RepID=A0A6A5ZKV4_9PLEO|nr:hypothetical protein BDV96DRAFT_596202 [Lophiotrema nucula]